MSADILQKLQHVRLDDSWKVLLADFLLNEKMTHLRSFLTEQLGQGKTIFPPNSQIFRALNEVPVSQVKVVILGQDPYHGVGQANGLSFAVNKGVPLPPSLRNIYHELHTDLGIVPAQHGDLSAWAKQGVLLLNSVLTVEKDQAASHKGQGWEQFTDEVVNKISQHCQGVVFILWGAYAQKKGQHIDKTKHLVLTASHPSPLSANRGGFFGCKVFSKANQYLIAQNKTAIDWTID